MKETEVRDTLLVFLATTSFSDAGSMFSCIFTAAEVLFCFEDVAEIGGFGSSGKHTLSFFITPVCLGISLELLSNALEVVEDFLPNSKTRGIGEQFMTYLLCEVEILL